MLVLDGSNFRSEFRHFGASPTSGRHGHIKKLLKTHFELGPALKLGLEPDLGLATEINLAQKHFPPKSTARLLYYSMSAAQGGPERAGR